MSHFRIAAYGERHPVVFGMHLLFHRSVEVVQVAVQDDLLHTRIIHKILLQNNMGGDII